MAKLVVTSATNYISVVTNDYAAASGIDEAVLRKSVIERVNLLHSGGVKIIIDNNPPWLVSYDGTYGYKVDSIDGVAPTSDSDLLSKIKAIL